MSEQEMTALVEEYLRESRADPEGGRHAFVDGLAEDYLALLAERDALLAEREDLKEALGGALKECREHNNGDDHWRTSDAVLDQWRQMLTRQNTRATR